MTFTNDWDNSLFKTLSSKKTHDNRAAVRRKLEKIRMKLRSGARLTAAEKEFLRRYAPQLYEQAMAIERERNAYEERLKQCRTEEELERVRLEKMAEMAAMEEEEAETALVRMAQMEAAEKEAAEEWDKMPEESVKEDSETEIEKNRPKDRYEEAGRAREEAGGEPGIYGRPRYGTADVEAEGQEQGEGIVEFASLPKQEAAFARGHTAYRMAAEAEELETERDEEA